MPQVNRRKFLITAGLAAASTAALAEDTVIREPNHPDLVTVDLDFDRLPAAFEGFTILQLSDFHYDEIFSIHPIRRAIEIVNHLNPDLVVLTGDFVTVPFYGETGDSRWAKPAEPCAKLLSQLRSRLGSIAVLGNHDMDSDPVFIASALQAHGISVLRNRSQSIEQNGSRLWFCGLDSLERHPKIEPVLSGIPAEEFKILLVHEPDFADVASRHPIDLQLSGHSHGGQIWIPGFGAPWLPKYARKYPRGKYMVHAMPLYTNIGLGTIRMPVRLNCTPEVTLFTLRAANGNKTFGSSSYTGRGTRA